MSTIAKLQRRAYQQAADKGFHDNEPTEPRAVLSLNAERIALMHSELSEALEELRSGRAASETYYPRHKPGCPVSDHRLFQVKPEQELPCMCTPKPEGVPSELADVVIGVLDFCGSNDIDLESMLTEKLDYNASRSHKHGGKRF